MQLIENAKHFYKFLSVQLSALAATLLAFAQLFPDAAMQAYMFLPVELKSMVPMSGLRWVVVVILVASIIARLIKQPKVAATTTIKDGTTLLLIMGIGAYVAMLTISATSLA